MTLRIAMWSGPRNLSTAMMYAFAARGDCDATDEPLYAAYLAATGLHHPMQAEILASQPTDPALVTLTGAGPTGAPLWYQKHMTHHILPGTPRGWMTQARHAFLIRHPYRVTASYHAKRENPTLADLGYAQQETLWHQIADLTGTPPVVVDSADIRARPEPLLRALCAALDIPFTPRMLSWPAGPKPHDGAWAPAWYAAVHRSTGFDAAEGPLPDLPPDLRAVADQAIPAYQALAARALTA